MDKKNGDPNSLMEIREFFAADAEPLRPDEFRTFWLSLTDAEREEFKKADLKA